MPPSSVPLPDQRRSGWLASGLVWAVWAGMSLALLGYVAAFARDVPWWDDWDLVPVLSGQEPATVGWLWERHNEHRIPLPKLIHLALAAPAGCDFRLAAYGNALALSVAALALILAARRLRGHTSWPDALFPLLLLHWGQYDNLLWSFQVQFVSSTALFCIALAALATAPAAPSPRQALVVAVCALLLPFCGLNGAILAPALAIWLARPASRVAQLPRSGDHQRLPGPPVPRRGRCVVVRFQPSSQAGHGLGATVRVSGAADDRGPGRRGAGGAYLGLFVLLASLAGAVAVGWTFHAGHRDRLRGLGLLAGFAALVTLGAAVGWGRASHHVDHPGDITGVTRYVTLMAPLPGLAALLWITLRNRLMPALLCTAIALMLPANMFLGLDAARWRTAELDRLRHDARQGVSPADLSASYGPVVHAVDTDLLAQRFEMLRTARLGPYRKLSTDDPDEE